MWKTIIIDNKTMWKIPIFDVKDNYLLKWIIIHIDHFLGKRIIVFNIDSNQNIKVTLLYAWESGFPGSP